MIETRIVGGEDITLRHEEAARNSGMATGKDTIDLQARSIFYSWSLGYSHAAVSAKAIDIDHDGDVNAPDWDDVRQGTDCCRGAGYFCRPRLVGRSVAGPVLLSLKTFCSHPAYLGMRVDCIWIIAIFD